MPFATTFRTAIVAMVLCGCDGLARAPSKAERVSRPYSGDIAPPERPLAVIGDTQRTSMWERLALREVNDDQQRILFDALEQESLGALAHLGDMVFDAASESDWRRFDDRLASIADRRVPVLPALATTSTQARAHSSGVGSRPAFRGSPR